MVELHGHLQMSETAFTTYEMILCLGQFNSGIIPFGGESIKSTFLQANVSVARQTCLHMFPAPVTRHPYCLTWTEQSRIIHRTFTAITGYVKWFSFGILFWEAFYLIIEWFFQGVQGRKMGHRVIGKPHPREVVCGTSCLNTAGNISLRPPQQPWRSGTWRAVRADSWRRLRQNK